MTTCYECNKPSDNRVCSYCRQRLKHEAALESGHGNTDYHQRKADMWRELANNVIDH